MVLIYAKLKKKYKLIMMYITENNIGFHKLKNKLNSTANNYIYIFKSLVMFLLSYYIKI